MPRFAPAYLGARPVTYTPSLEATEFERNPPPKTKLRINHEHGLLPMQRCHDLRTRALLLVLGFPARATRSRSSHNRVPLSEMSDEKAELANDASQRD